MTKKLTTKAVLLAVALVLGYAESLFFPMPAVPGLKLGLANITVLLALYSLGPASALTLTLLKAILTTFLFGNPVALLYALLGSSLSWCAMTLSKKAFGILGVSVWGSLFHNLGQLTVACLLTNSIAPLYYLPALLLGGTLFGGITALCAKGVLGVLNGQKK